jgi:PKD repeat protein/subtilisin family serine protease
MNSAAHDGAAFFDRQRALAFAASVTPAERKYVVELNARAFLPFAGADGLADALPEDAPAGTVYLQFANHPRDEQRQQLRACGVELLAYASGCTWTARGSRDAFAAAMKLNFVRAVAGVDLRDKLHLQVFRGDVPAYAQAPDGRARLRALAAPGTTAAALDAAMAQSGKLRDNGVRAAAAHPSVLGPRFDVVVDIALARALAALDAVAFVEFVPPPAASRDATLDSQSNITDIRDTGPMLTGNGVRVAVRELGNITAHVDFAGRLQVVDTDGDTGASNVNHATAVTGIVGSDGVAQSSATGVAKSVSLLGYVVGADPDTFATTDIVAAANNWSCRISNHSYGPSSITSFGDYQTISADWDGAMRDKDLVGTFAQFEEVAGNKYKKTDYFVGAKNTICVGSTSASAHAGDIDPLVAPVNGLASFTDFGPMNDGRIKPDLVAFGDNVTVDRGTNGTASETGTSFSTPAVTGVAALVFQRYKTKTSAEPTAALTKALLCNAATDLGNAGPDAAYGFGILNAEEAIRIVDLHQSASNSPFLADSLTNGGEQVFSVTLAGAPFLKATMCWMDPAGNPAAAKALVNDLDMEVQTPTGTILYPYSLDPANPAANATATGPNRVDPIEQVFVNAPADGTWTIRVKGTSIPSGSQSFAICLNWPTQPLGLAAQIVAVPESGEAPLAVSFTGRLSSGSPTSYAWDFGDGATGTGVDVSHSYPQPGNYLVRLTVANALSQTATTTKSIAVLGLAVLASPDSGPAPLAVSFAPVTVRTDVTYSWSFGDGTAPLSGASQAHTYTVPGVYTATMTVQDAQGNKFSATKTITVAYREVDAFPLRAKAKFDFGGGDALQFSMIAGDLVHTRQEARLAIADGTFEGQTYLIRVGGQDVARVLIDRRGNFVSKAVKFKLNLTKGEISCTLKGFQLAQKLGLTTATNTPTITVPVEVVGSSAIYRATFTMSYKFTGTAGVAKK